MSISIRCIPLQLIFHDIYFLFFMYELDALNQPQVKFKINFQTVLIDGEIYFL